MSSPVLLHDPSQAQVATSPGKDSDATANSQNKIDNNGNISNFVVVASDTAAAASTTNVLGSSTISNRGHDDQSSSCEQVTEVPSLSNSNNSNSNSNSNPNPNPNPNPNTNPHSPSTSSNSPLLSPSQQSLPVPPMTPSQLPQYQSLPLVEEKDSQPLPHRCCHPTAEEQSEAGDHDRASTPSLTDVSMASSTNDLSFQQPNLETSLDITPEKNLHHHEFFSAITASSVHNDSTLVDGRVEQTRESESKEVQNQTPSQNQAPVVEALPASAVASSSSSNSNSNSVSAPIASSDPASHQTLSADLESKQDTTLAASSQAPLSTQSSCNWKKTALSFHDYRLLGKTLMGQIFSANTVDPRNGAVTHVAVKEFEKSCIQNRVSLEGFPVAETPLEEIRIHKLLSDTIDCPYVLKLVDWWENETKIFVALEYADSDIWTFKATKGLGYAEVKRVMVQVIKALHSLHSHGFAHRDISPENILVKEDAKVTRLCDFGTAVECKENSQMQEKEAQRKPGKVRYMAPELYNMQLYNPQKADMWSCGVLMFQLIYVDPCTEDDLYNMPVSGDSSFAQIWSGKLESLLEKRSKRIGPSAIDFMKRLLCPEAKRMSAAEALAHPWLK